MTSKTLILQSHRTPLPAQWLATCMATVKDWARLNQYEYRFMGDEFFEVVSSALLEKTQHQKIIATDLARLKWLQRFLDEGYETVIWCDADFLIFAPDQFTLPCVEALPEGYVLGREVWIQPHRSGSRKLKANIKVHNAFMLFRKGNSFLEFYTDNAERLLIQTRGPMPPQFIGPKLLTAIHNVVQCPVMESAGMLSPMVIKDLLEGGGSALNLFQQKSRDPIAGANLCSSLSERDELSDDEMERVVDLLIRGGNSI